MKLRFVEEAPPEVKHPGYTNYWCPGKACGEGIVCRDRTYNEGYCLEPKLRQDAINTLYHRS